MKIKNIDELRKHLVSCIEDVASGTMSVEELGIVSKASEATFSSIKMQLMYNNMRGEQPDIDFIQDCNKGKPKHQLMIDEPGDH